MHSDESGQPSKKASEKLAALESEINKLRRQRAQQEALLKARRASEDRVKKLEGEIESIRAQKVELTRRQREEAEAHRAQRVARERELIQLRRRGEKQAAQLAKLEGVHAKQSMVLKRKNEELENAQKKARTGNMSAQAAGIPHRRLTVAGVSGPGASGSSGGSSMQLLYW